ncbi:MAG: glutathione gamma-glutamylcysteinyltransferase [Pseudanabaena sp.]|nr:MAG: glutathione gamma-glutamylcysteinyltransferase [Pseudanabaena sp.]
MVHKVSSKVNTAIKVLILGFALSACSAIAQPLALPESLISVTSDSGKKLLSTSQSKTDYSPLSNYFVTQSHPAYCGVASMTIVINALHGDRKLTQDNFFDNQKTNQIASALSIRWRGMNLDTLGKLLESHDVKVQVYHAIDTNLSTFRDSVTENLKQSNNFVLVNYLRRSIGQESGGHISPIAAYDRSTDRFLILDVASYKYPPVWVKADELWKSMNTIDNDGGKTRGFVLVSR